MTGSTFLFCDQISAERIRWYTGVLTAVNNEKNLTRPETISIFLTGDALFSLIDARTQPSWNALSALPFIRIIADADELQVQGLKDAVCSGCPYVDIRGHDSPEPFWESLVSTLKKEWTGIKRAGFLLCNAPYMSRVPVYMLRFLNNVHRAGLHPELYTYLNGVHTLHDGQRPSEFENIGKGVSALAGAAALSGRDSWCAACSRCATARGYYQLNAGTGFCEPSSCIQDIEIRPLKQILARFSEHHPILSHAGGGIVYCGEPGKNSPHLLVCITYLPYYTEWAFGGLSLAIAAAMEGTPTTILFIEDGVYALHGTQEVPKHDKVFNIQEMIAVTTDVTNLQYCVHAPSLADRGIQISGELSMIREVTNEDLARVLCGTGKENSTSALRMMFF